MNEEPNPPVEIVDLEPEVVPDNSFDEAYAIYLRLSYDPPYEWQLHFERLMAREVRQRTISFVPNKLRVVISRRDNLDMILRQMNALTRQTNIALDFFGE